MSEHLKTVSLEYGDDDVVVITLKHGVQTYVSRFEDDFGQAPDMIQALIGFWISDNKSGEPVSYEVALDEMGMDKETATALYRLLGVLTGKIKPMQYYRGTQSEEWVWCTGAEGFASPVETVRQPQDDKLQPCGGTLPTSWEAHPDSWRYRGT
jgi:hypothetical protein